MWQLGFMAGICTSGCMIPQLIKIIKTKSADDISWTMLGMNFVGNSLWIAHGGVNTDYMLITFASLSFLISIGLIGVKTITFKKSYTELKEESNNITHV
jgi:MtN3 and saliva related transmembrane protein